MLHILLKLICSCQGKVLGQHRQGWCGETAVVCAALIVAEDQTLYVRLYQRAEHFTPPEEVICCNMAHEREVEMGVRVNAPWQNKLASDIQDLCPRRCLQTTQAPTKVQR